MTRRPRLKSAPLILFVVAASVMVNCGHVNPTSPNDTPSASAVPPDATGQVVGIASVTNGISDVVISGVGAFRTRTLQNVRVAYLYTCATT